VLLLFLIPLIFVSFPKENHAQCRSANIELRFRGVIHVAAPRKMKKTQEFTDELMGGTASRCLSVHFCLLLFSRETPNIVTLDRVRLG